MKNFKELEAGKRYRAANGWIGVAEKYLSDIFPIIIKFGDSRCLAYKPNGNYFDENIEHEYNIVECLDVETPESIQAEIERLQKKLEELKKDEPMAVDESWLNGLNGIGVRNGGEYKNKGFYLIYHRWEIVVDSEGYSVLIAKRK